MKNKKLKRKGHSNSDVFHCLDDYVTNEYDREDGHFIIFSSVSFKRKHDRETSVNLLTAIFLF